MSSTLQAHRAAIVAALASVPGMGVVHDRERYATIQPLEGDEVSTQYMQAHFGAGETTQVTQYMSMSFKVPFSGVAAAGDEPGVAALLRMCSIAMTEDVGVSHTFDPVTNNPESGTIYCNIDGILHKSTGVRGNVKVDIAAKAVPSWQFDIMGAFVPLTDAPPPAAVYAKFLKALPVNKTNTTATLDSITLLASAPAGMSYTYCVQAVAGLLLAVGGGSSTAMGYSADGLASFRMLAVPFNGSNRVHLVNDMIVLTGAPGGIYTNY